MLTLNSNPVLGFRLNMPLVGRWVATLELSADEAPAAGSVADLVWTGDAARAIARGFVVRAGERSSTVQAVIAGGSGGLSGTIEARHFRGVQVRTVLSDALAEAGEALDVSSTRAILDTPLAFWSRYSADGLEALATLADKVGANWRCTPAGANAGRVWFGTEAWPVFPDFEALELDTDGAMGTVLYAPEDPRLVPGVTFRGRRILRVEHSFTRDAPLRTLVWV